MRKYIAAAALITLTAAAVFGGPDNNPVSAGKTQARNAGGLAIDGAFGNPALMGLSRYPRTYLSLFNTSLAMWSDKLAPPFNSYLLMDVNNIEHAVALYLTETLEQSFSGIEGASPEKVSEILTDELRGGIGFYAGFRTSPFAFATRGFGLNVKTYADVEVRIPEGLLLPIFSETDGFAAGNSLDFSQLSAEAIAATEVAVKVGFPLAVPIIDDYLKLDRGAFGVGLKYVMGHSLFLAKADPSSELYYDQVGNRYNIDASLDITTTGMGLSGDWNMNSPFDDGIGGVVNGQGWGLDLGTVFHNDRHFVSVDIQDFGMILWGNVRQTTMRFKKEGFDLIDFTDRFDDVFDREKSGGGMWPNEEDSLKLSDANIVTWLPATFNLGYSYIYEFSGDWPGALASYVSGSAAYEQQLVKWPGRDTYMPRLSLGAALGLFNGGLPLRYGIIAGGTERLASVFGFGIDLRYLALDASYKAVGGAFLNAAKGFEAAAGLTFKWGYGEKEKRRKETVPPPVEEDTIPDPVIAVSDPVLPELEELPAAETPVIVVQMAVIPPPPPPPEPQPTVEEVEQINTSQRAINFRSGGAQLTESSYPALASIAELLKKYPHIRYEIQGHTDSDGSDKLNMNLSINRAAAVKKALIERDAPEASLISIGYGKHKPIADNSTVQGRALNRRVEFVLIETEEEYRSLKAQEGQQKIETRR